MTSTASFNILQFIEGIIKTTEKDVLVVIAQIKKGEQVVANDIHSSLKWVAANAPQIAQDIVMLEAFVQSAGILTPDVQLAIAAANKAVAGINAVAASVQAGKSDAQTLVDGYLAVKNANAAAAGAAVAAVNA